MAELYPTFLLGFLWAITQISCKVPDILDSKMALFFFFVRSLFQKMRTQMKLLFSETSVALVFYCLGSRTRTMVSLNPVGSHSVCNFFIQNNDAQL